MLANPSLTELLLGVVSYTVIMWSDARLHGDACDQKFVHSVGLSIGLAWTLDPQYSLVKDYRNILDANAVANSLPKYCI